MFGQVTILNFLLLMLSLSLTFPGLCGVVGGRTLEVSVGVHPVVPPLHGDVDPGAPPGLKVTAPQRGARPVRH